MLGPPPCASRARRAERASELRGCSARGSSRWRRRRAATAPGSRWPCPGRRSSWHSSCACMPGVSASGARATTCAHRPSCAARPRARAHALGVTASERPPSASPQTALSTATEVNQRPAASSSRTTSGPTWTRPRPTGRWSGPRRTRRRRRGRRRSRRSGPRSSCPRERRSARRRGPRHGRTRRGRPSRRETGHGDGEGHGAGGDRGAGRADHGRGRSGPTVGVGVADGDAGGGAAAGRGCSPPARGADQSAAQVGARPRTCDQVRRARGRHAVRSAPVQVGPDQGARAAVAHPRHGRGTGPPLEVAPRQVGVAQVGVDQPARSRSAPRRSAPHRSAPSRIGDAQVGAAQVHPRERTSGRSRRVPSAPWVRSHVACAARRSAKASATVHLPRRHGHQSTFNGRRPEVVADSTASRRHAIARGQMGRALRRRPSGPTVLDGERPVAVVDGADECGHLRPGGFRQNVEAHLDRVAQMGSRVRTCPLPPCREGPASPRRPPVWRAQGLQRSRIISMASTSGRHGSRFQVALSGAPSSWHSRCACSRGFFGLARGTRAAPSCRGCRRPARVRRPAPTDPPVRPGRGRGPTRWASPRASAPPSASPQTALSTATEVNQRSAAASSRTTSGPTWTSALPHGSVVRPATNAPAPSRTTAVPSVRAAIVRPSCSHPRKGTGPSAARRTPTG